MTVEDASPRLRVPVRLSLRVRMVLVVVGVLVAPQLFVIGWIALERRFEGSMQRNAAWSAEEAGRLIDGPFAPSPSSTTREPSGRPPIEESIDAIARAHWIRIRVLTPDGDVLVDRDHDEAIDLSQRLGDLFLGPDDAPSLSDFDATLGRPIARPEIEQAAAGAPSAGCRATPGAELIVCHAARRAGPPEAARIVYAQDSSRRPIATLYGLRHQLGRLTLVTLPLALLLAWWMGSRVLRPIEALRRQALDEASRATPRADLALRGADEATDLATAFNALLAALEERRVANEASVADLVHELKNPVATIRACAESLQGAAPDADRASRLARLLEGSSARLDTVVSQFLELARAEAGMVHEPRAVVDLADLTRGIARAMTDDARFQGVEFRVEAAAPAPVTGVATRLDSVVRNLLENAASFSGTGGEVVVRVLAGPDQVELLVSDTGPGIAPEDLSKVFARFYTTRERGSGLGLAVVRAIVEAHGGRIEVRSELGQGATFRAVLPRAD